MMKSKYLVNLINVDGFIIHWSSTLINLQDHCQISTSFDAISNDILYCWYTKESYCKIIYPYLLVKAGNTPTQSMTHGIAVLYFNGFMVPLQVLLQCLLINFSFSTTNIPQGPYQGQTACQETQVLKLFPQSRPRDETEGAQSPVLNQCSWSTLSLPFVTLQIIKKYIHLPTWPLHAMPYLLCE